MNAKAKKTMNIVGKWAFFIAVILAVIVGGLSGLMKWDIPAWMFVFAVIVGLAIGLLNISEKEATGFLVALTFLALIGVGGFIQKFPDMLGTVIKTMASMLLAVLLPAGFIVGIKEVFVKARK